MPLFEFLDFVTENKLNCNHETPEAQENFQIIASTSYFHFLAQVFNCNFLFENLLKFFSISIRLWLIRTRPMVRLTDNLVIIINEFFMYWCGVNLLLFTEYVAEPGKRWNCGFSFMFFVFSCVVFNIGTVIYVEGKNCIADMKTKYAKWKAKN